MKRSQSDYENDLAAMLIGNSIAAVRYFELQYDHSNSPYYRHDTSPGHLLDYGCDLEMADGSVCGIIWDHEFAQYGVGASRVSLSNQLTNYRVWDVTSDSHWACLVDKAIINAQVYWSWIQYEGQQRQQYPQDIEIEFEDGSVVLFSASQYHQNEDNLWGMSDDIAVVFGKESAHRYSLGPYASDD